MKKRRGADFKRRLIDLAQCPTCCGNAVIKGVFHELSCDCCNASGWVVATTGEALTLDELVTQLSMRLQVAARQIEQLRAGRAFGPAAYQDGNRLGAGGINYTGD